MYLHPRTRNSGEVCGSDWKVHSYNENPLDMEENCPVEIPSTQTKVPWGISFERIRRLGYVASQYIWFVNEIEGLSLTKARLSASQRSSISPI